MCTNTKHIRPKSIYPNALYDLASVEVPCYKCDECREQYRHEWLNRLCFEYYANKGGCAVFLTFTYNDEHLPHYTDDTYMLDNNTPFSVACFCREHILSFLQTLKRYYIKRFGYVPFKYFIASEYGHTTKRPHYHALFFLHDVLASDWQTFCEVCREIWSASIFVGSSVTNIESKHYGFMFPNLVGARLSNGKVVGGQYLDNKGKDRSPLIRDAAGGMLYCSKYVLKDLAYFTPAVNEYLANALPDKVSEFKRVLPKHWQSNKLGYSALDVVRSNVESAINTGIPNPLTLKKVAIPSYVANKLLYYNVFNGRFSDDGKKLYDRYLTDFGEKYLTKIFKLRIERLSEKMYVYFQQILNTSRSALANIGIDLVTAKPADFVPLALFHSFIKNLKFTLLDEILSENYGSLTDLFDVDLIAPYYYRTKSTKYKKEHPSFYTESMRLCHFDYLELFKHYEVADSLFKELALLKNTEKLKKQTDTFNQKVETNEKYTYGFPLDLC